jgi:hypothetical protein
MSLVRLTSPWNAHINHNFLHALTTVGPSAADGSSHKPDHVAYHQRLAWCADHG